MHADNLTLSKQVFLINYNVHKDDIPIKYLVHNQKKISFNLLDETYIKTMKMAIAMACIRSKPEGLTAKEYTEQLCQNYLQKQQECQDKLKSAENEILQLRQQLVLQSTLGQNEFLPLRNTGICQFEN